MSRPPSDSTHSRPVRRLLCVAALLAAAVALPRARAMADEMRPVIEPLPPPHVVSPAERVGPPPAFGAQTPTYTTAPRPALPAQPVGPDDRPLPINLPTALRLSDARPIVIAAAQAGLQVASAQWSQARVLWLPNVNGGAAYFRHDGL